MARRESPIPGTPGLALSRPRDQERRSHAPGERSGVAGLLATFRRRQAKYLFLFLPVVIFCAVAWYLVAGARFSWEISSGGTSATGNLSLGPDGPNVTDIRLVQLDGERQAWVMTAPRAQRSGGDRTSIWEPILTAFPEGGGEMRITARRGVVNETSRAMVFQEGVVILDREGNRFTTERLEFDPDRSILSTDLPFQLEGPRLRLQGVGLRLYQNSGIMQVLQSARAEFRKETQ